MKRAITEVGNGYDIRCQSGMKSVDSVPSSFHFISLSLCAQQST